MASQWKYLLLVLVLSYSSPTVFGSDAENSFALNLFRQVYDQEKIGNFVLSPPIIRTTFALLYQLANPTLSSEMQQAMFFPEDKSEAAIQLKDDLIETFESRDHLNVRSTLFRDLSELSLKFAALLNGYLAPEVALAYASSSADPNTVISVLPKTSSMPSYNLFATSEFNLTAAWKNKFNPTDGREGLFKFSNGYWQVNFMKQTARFGIMKQEQFTALEMDYDWATDLSMILIIPNDEDVPLGTVIQQFDLNTYKAIDARLRQRFVHVAVPRFSTSSNTQLSLSVAKMGMVSAFLANAFEVYRYRGSGMGPIQQTGAIRVAEGGTEEVEPSPSKILPPALLPTFRADRPFMYLVRNRTSKNILMVGHYSYYET